LTDRLARLLRDVDHRSTDSQIDTRVGALAPLSRRVQHNTQYPRPKLSNSLFAAPGNRRGAK